MASLDALLGEDDDDEPDAAPVPATARQFSANKQKSKRRSLVETMSDELERDRHTMAPEDVALLRAVPVSQVLRGSLLRRTSLWTTPTSMGGPSPTLRYSKQVDGDVPFLITYDRDHPYPAVAHLALLGYSNGAAALAVSMAVAVAMTAAQLVFGPLATPPCVTSAFGYTVPRCHLKSPSLHGATYCAALTYFLVFFLWHRVPWRRSRLCFFAPLCSALHGPDKERSQRMRPFFLQHSERLCVVWSPRYFTRLKSLFDVAAFVHLSRPGVHLSRRGGRTSKEDDPWQRVDVLTAAEHSAVFMGHLILGTAWIAYDFFGGTGAAALPPRPTASRLRAPARL